jgi:uncharacterized DUF497 family protein
MENLKITPDVLLKLSAKHSVTREEVEQCFYNKAGKLLIDTREKHKTNPPTLWFLALTNKGRLLKIVYIQIENIIHLKSAFSPNQTEIDIYSRHG